MTQNCKHNVFHENRHVAKLQTHFFMKIAMSQNRKFASKNFPLRI